MKFTYHFYFEWCSCHISTLISCCIHYYMSPNIEKRPGFVIRSQCNWSYVICGSGWCPCDSCVRLTWVSILTDPNRYICDNGTLCICKQRQNSILKWQTLNRQNLKKLERFSAFAVSGFAVCETCLSFGMVVLDMSWLVFMYAVKKKGSVQNHGGRSAGWLVLVSGWLKIMGMCLLNSL